MREDIRHGHGANARGRKRPLAAARVVAVDHASVPVRSDGDAAVDMADDQVAVLVALAHRPRVAARRLLEVERMGDRRAVDAARAGHARQVAQLVDDGRIHHQHQAAVFLVQRFGHLHAEHRRVIQPAARLPRVADERVVNRIDAALDGAASAAAADNRVDAVQINPMLPEKPVDDVHPVIELVVDRRKGQQHGGIVERILREQTGVVFKHGQLGRGRTRIDDKNSIALHDLSPTAAVSAAS